MSFTGTFGTALAYFANIQPGLAAITTTSTGTTAGGFNRQWGRCQPCSVNRNRTRNVNGKWHRGFQECSNRNGTSLFNRQWGRRRSLPVRWQLSEDRSE